MKMLCAYIVSLFLFASTHAAVALDKRFLVRGGFQQGNITGYVTSPDIDEASGCAMSRKHPGVLYTLNDHAPHGHENKVYVLHINGTLLATYDIHDADNEDWEDIAIGPCDNSDTTVDCLYIADTGDTKNANILYRFEEPYFIEDREISVEAKLKFRYIENTSWDQSDCETIMVDPHANVYLISKALNANGYLFKVPKSAWNSGHRVHITTLGHVPANSTHHDPVGGDISRDGNEVLVKVHEGIYYWNMHGTHDYGAIMTQPGIPVSYTRELQGESVCWDPSGNGYYTLSEGNDSTHMRSQASSVGTPSAHQLNAIQMMFCCRAYGCLYWNGQYENLMRYMFSIAGGFAPAAKTGVVTDHDIDEASGCAVSRLNRNVLYTLNDHGGKNRVYAVNINGTLVGELTIDGATNVDWEDLAIGPCDNTDSFSSCIYIGDFGESGSANTIYKIEEPYINGKQHISLQSTLKFSWNQPDCETLMVDPQANVYIVSRVDDGRGILFQLPNSAWGTGQKVQISSTAVIYAPSTHHDPVGGDISPNGKEVLIKVHEGIYYWKVGNSMDYQAALTTPGTPIHYHPERQGEAVCWEPSGAGFYTMSEGRNEPIYYYARA